MPQGSNVNMSIAQGDIFGKGLQNNEYFC